jgi:hypothetical protein
MDMKNRFRGAVANNPYIQNYPTPQSFSTGNQTITAAMLIAGIIVGNVGGGTTYTYTLPTAALLRQGLAPYMDVQGVQVGDVINTLIVAGGTTGILALSLGSGGSFDTNGNQSIPAGQSKYVYIRFTNATPGSETYTVYA